MPEDKTVPSRTGNTPIPQAKNEESASQSQINQLIRNITDLTGLLRSQSDMLRQKGMNLPPGSLRNLRTLKAKVESIAKQISRTQSELKQLRALADTTALITSTLETSVVLNQVMDTVVKLTGAERGYIVLKDRNTGQFDQFRVARGLDTAQLSDGDNGSDGNELIVSKTIVNEVAESGEPILTDNASQDERWQGQQSIVGFALRSIIAVPLLVRDDVIGVVYCDNRIHSGLFNAGDRDMLAAFANQAGVAIENARLFEAARHRLAEITEMRDLMDNIFTSITNGVITVDNHGVVTTCNAAANTILGIDYDAVGKALYDILPPVDDEFEAALKQVEKDDSQHSMDIETVVEAYGARSWFVIVSSLRDERGRGQGAAIVIDDLTDQKKHEAQLAELRRYLPGALVDNFSSIDDIDVVGQEREITVIATDVRGFTTFSERLEPEQLMEIINKYLSLASDAINLYEGIVDRYMGDAVTGLFNTQLNPQKDHAIRAVRAAMSIIMDLYALHEILPEDQRLFYGIGIHTGTAFLGNVGSEDRQEFSVLGDAATIAKILEGNAKGGEVIISEATYELVKDFFDCEAAVPEKTKGRDDLARVYKVTGRKKGAKTGPMFIDPELADLLADLDS